MKISGCSFILETEKKENSHNNIDNSVKILGATALFLGIIALISIYSCTATHYEISIFRNIPVYVLIILSIYVIITCSILKYLLENPDKKLYFFIYFYLMLFLDVVFISLPIIRGYAFYDNVDTFTHVGIIKDIIEYGHPYSDNFYPGLHILVSVTNIIVNINILSIYRYILIIISIGFFFYFYLWNKTIFSNKIFILFSTSFSLILFLKNGYYTTMVPNGYTVLLLPLVLFLLYKKSPNYKILLVFFLALIPFSHPLTTIILGMLIVFNATSTFVYDRYVNKVHSTLKLNPIVVLITSFIFWISSFYILGESIEKLVAFIKMESVSPVAEVGSGFAKLNMDFNDRIIYTLKVYAPQMVIILLAVMSIFYMVNLLRRHRKAKCFSNLTSTLFAISVSFIILGFVLLVALVVGDPGLMPMRSVNFLFILSVPLAGYLLSQLYPQIKLKSQITFLVIILLTAFPYAAAITTLYDSPYVKMPGRHVTFAQLDGMTWFFINRNESLNNSQLSASAPWRYSDVLYGESFKDKHRLSRYNNSWTVVPDHFDNLTQNLSNRYLIINEYDYYSYIEAWEETNRYNSYDYVKLEKNRDVTKIYSNGDLIIRYVGFGTNSTKQINDSSY